MTFMSACIPSHTQDPAQSANRLQLLVMPQTTHLATQIEGSLLLSMPWRNLSPATHPAGLSCRGTTLCTLAGPNVPHQMAARELKGLQQICQNMLKIANAIRA